MNWSEKVAYKSKVQFYHRFCLIQNVFFLKPFKNCESNLKKMSICIWYFAKLAQKKTCLHNDSNYACTLCHDCAQHLVFQERGDEQSLQSKKL